jgi:cupin 2 domain-containing protein
MLLCMASSETRPAIQSGHLREGIPAVLPGELLTELVRGKDTRIERIVSRGHASPDGFWYDQDEHELVVLLSGSASVELEGDRVVSLTPLTWLNIPAHVRHRVTCTDPEVDTLWLAIFYR